MSEDQGGITISKKHAMIIGVVLFVLLAVVAGGGVAFMLTRSSNNSETAGIATAPVSGSPGDLVQRYYREANAGNVDEVIKLMPPVTAGRYYVPETMQRIIRNQTRNGSIDHIDIYDETEKGLIARCRFTVFFTDGTREKRTEYFIKVNGAWQFSTQQAANYPDDELPAGNGGAV